MYIKIYRVTFDIVPTVQVKCLHCALSSVHYSEPCTLSTVAPCILSRATVDRVKGPLLCPQCFVPCQLQGALSTFHISVLCPLYFCTILAENDTNWTCIHYPTYQSLYSSSIFVLQIFFKSSAYKWNNCSWIITSGYYRMKAIFFGIFWYFRYIFRFFQICFEKTFFCEMFKYT